MTPRPPRMLAWLVARFTPRHLRDAVLGDLAESFARRVARDGRWVARCWYLRQAGSVAGRLGPLTDEPTSLTPARSPFQGVWADLRFALRLHLRRPAATLLVLATLGLGIGASTAIFSVIRPALLEPLPYPAGSRLVRLWEPDRGRDGRMGFATLDDLARSATTLDAVVAMRSWSPNLLRAGEPVGLVAQRVGHRFFGMLGVVPAIGRDFAAADDVPAAAPVAILAADLWRDRFGADPNVVGRSISLDGTPYLVIGVLPDDFESVLAPGAELWTPLRYDLALPQACAECRHLVGLGRLAAGMSLAAATQEVNGLVGRLAAADRDAYGSGTVVVEPLRHSVIAESRPTLILLFAAVSLLLLVVIVNVAHLLLSQAVQRRQEFAVRMAVGSGRDRVVRQVMLESALLGLVGSAVAVMLTRAVLGAIRAAATGLPRPGAVAVDGGVVRFGLGLGLVVGMLAGLLPALVSLRSAGGGIALALRPWRRHGIRRALVVAQVTLASVLVVAAGLLSRSMTRLLAVDPGFQADGLVTARVDPTGPSFETDAEVWRYVREARTAVLALPGVVDAALVNELPLAGGSDQYGVAAESRLATDPKAWTSADRYSVTTGYFAALRIPVTEGRAFTGADRAGTAPVAVVNRRYARNTFVGGSPLGQRIRIGGREPAVWYTIVGVVGNVRQDGLDRPPNPQVYVPFDQWPGADRPMTVVARTVGDPGGAAPALRAALRALHPDPTITRVVPMTAVIDRALARRTVVLRLFQAFGLLALTLAAVGCYGVMASDVAERRRELGIRAALGASAGRLGAAVVRETLGLAVAGLALGIPISLGLAIRLGPSTTAVRPTDLPAYGLAIVGLLVAMLVAAWVPARRAARLDPTRILRSE